MAREGHLRDTRNHTQERELGREATTSAFRKASFLDGGIKTFFRGLMAPGIKGIETQKQLSERQPALLIRAEGCGRLAAGHVACAALSVHGKGASCDHASFRNGRWLALFEVVEGKDLGRRPQLKMTPRRRHQLQFKPYQRDQLWGFFLLFNMQQSLEGKRERLISATDPQGPHGA